MKLFYFLIFISLQVNANSVECIELNNLILASGSSSPDKNNLVIEEFNKNDSLKSCEDKCSIMTYCILGEDSKDCIDSLWNTVNSISERMKKKNPDPRLVTFARNLLDYTDGEVTEVLIDSFSYLLPANIELLVDSMEKKTILRRKLDSIIEPNIEVRVINEPCTYYKSILSMSEGVKDVNHVILSEIVVKVQKQLSILNCTSQ